VPESELSQVSTHEEEHEYRRASGASRLLPTVSFGLRAAVLAGVVAVSLPAPGITSATAGRVVAPAATTVALSGAINMVSNNVNTTCCGSK